MYISFVRGVWGCRVDRVKDNGAEDEKSIRFKACRCSVPRGFRKIGCAMRSHMNEVVSNGVVVRMLP